MRVSAAVLVISAVAATLATSASMAGGVRVRVGDLSQPAGARDFDHRLQRAAERFCASRYLPAELDKTAACIKAAREEGLAQLSVAQRDALATALGPGVRLASAAP